MALKVALQMDVISSIKPKSDSTLLLGLEAQKRGHELYYYTPDKLVAYNNSVTAQGHKLKLFPDSERYYELGESQQLDLGAMDVILLRQDPPFDMAYIASTYLLERLQPKVLVANNPASVRNHPEKLFPEALRCFAPPTLITADAGEIAHFRAEHKDIVIKPLFGFGGHGVLRLKEDDDNFAALMEMLFAASKEPWVVQPFLPDVKTGERRIILIDGEFGGVIGRLPAEGEIRSNMRVGGMPVKAELTLKQREICDALKPWLKEKGILFAGVDVIGDYLTEINVTSPTGLAAITKLYGIKLEEKFWDAVEARLS